MSSSNPVTRTKGKHQMESKKEINNSDSGCGCDVSAPKRRVGLIYDERMCKHFDTQDNNHPENPNRILAIWDKLQSSGITKRCVVLNAEELEDKHAALVHSKKHIELVKGISSKKFNSRRHSIAKKFDSIYFNKGSTEEAYLAAGSVIEVAERVAKGDLDSAFAIVRRSGHHTEVDKPMWFCLFNNVAIATSFLLNERADLGIKKILIVDWGVHHGNGAQKMFWKDPRVLFFYVHRHENGSFYPSGDDGSYTMVGNGAGYNINVPWQKDRCGDADYLAVWEHVLIPVAKEFNPDMIIISAGFDAAINDPLGGCHVTPDGYAIMLKQLMEFANGKIVMALEGGYNLESLANSVFSCIQVLLNEGPVTACSEARPCKSTWQIIRKVRRILSLFWASFADLPKSLTSRKTRQIQILEDEHESGLQAVSEDLEEVLQTLSSVGVKDDDKISTACTKAVTTPLIVQAHSFVPVEVEVDTRLNLASSGSDSFCPSSLIPAQGAVSEVLNETHINTMASDPSPPVVAERSTKKRAALTYPNILVKKSRTSAGLIDAYCVSQITNTCPSSWRDFDIYAATKVAVFWKGKGFGCKVEKFMF